VNYEKYRAPRLKFMPARNLNIVQVYIEALSDNRDVSTYAQRRIPSNSSIQKGERGRSKETEGRK